MTEPAKPRLDLPLGHEFVPPPEPTYYVEGTGCAWRCKRSKAEHEPVTVS